jgi:hypothetical protein
MNVGPQATRYKLQVPGRSTPGLFNYYISDQRSRVDSVWRGENVPSAAFYRQTLSTVTIVTKDRIYTINAPEGTPSGCAGKYWHVFSQDAVSGAITLYTDVNGTPSTVDDAYKCGGDLITGEPAGGAASRLPDSNWPAPSTPQTMSWLNFGGISGFTQCSAVAALPVTNPHRADCVAYCAGRPAQTDYCFYGDYTGIDWDVR